MAAKNKVSFSWSQYCGICCGVWELGEFGFLNFAGRLTTYDYYDENADEYGYGSDDQLTVTAPTCAELWPKVFEKMVEAKGRRAGYAHIWFVKKKDAPKFQMDGLRRQFMNSDKVWDLGKHPNRNHPGNILHGFSFKVPA